MAVLIKRKIDGIEKKVNAAVGAVILNINVLDKKLDIKETEILLVKKGDYWILPGGKPEDGEDDVSCLRRELSEEIPGIKIYNFRNFGKSFYGKSPIKKEHMMLKVWLVNAERKEYKSAAEINVVEWAGFPLKKEYNFSEVTGKVINILKRNLFLN